MDGRRLERVVQVVTVAAFMEPACSCGSSCMGRCRFWFELGGTLHTVDVDRIRLGWGLDALFDAAPPDGHAALPRLARDWHENTGWCGLGVPFGTAVSRDDLAEFATALEPHMEGGFTAALHDLVRAAEAAGLPVWAMED